VQTPSAVLIQSEWNRDAREFSVTDPTWYTTTWKGRNRLRRSNEPIFEFACHEGNYAVRFILQGMRERDGETRSE
jgi:hypothetical protein